MIESTIGWTRKVEVIEAMEEGEEVQLKVRGRGVWVCWDIYRGILLMVQKSGDHHLGWC